jgi:hypothetical protein
LDKIYGFPKPDKPDEKATTYTRKSKKLMKRSFNSPPFPPLRPPVNWLHKGLCFVLVAT